MAANKVIAGDFKGTSVGAMLGVASVGVLPITKQTVSAYELITDEHRKSAASGIARGLVGGAILGPVGLLAGLSAKSKGTYTIAIEWSDSKKSLIEVDDKIYKAILRTMF